jgi:glycosyltransferase involved in cell wall biosynthesis
MTPPLKLLFVSEPAVDGVFRHVVGLSTYAIQANHNVHVVYSDRRSCPQLGPYLDLIRANGGETLNLGVSNTPEIKDLTALLRLRHFVSEIKPDIIHAASTKAGLLVRLLPFLGIKTPLFYSPHAYYGMGRTNGLKTLIGNTIELLLGHTGITLNISTDESDFAKTTLGIPSHRATTIFNGVHTAHFTPPSSEYKTQLRHRLGIPPEALVIGSMGRLSYQKNPEMLYNAFKELIHEYPHLYLLHVGKGELYESLKSMMYTFGIQERIVHKSYFDDPIQFYQAIDAFVLTSRYEGFALVCLEALSCDLPLIVTQCPGMRDLASLNLTHFWTAPVEDHHQFAAEIRAWIEDRKNERASNHRITAESLFDSQVCYQKTLDLYGSATQIRAQGLKSSRAQAKQFIH